MSHSIEPRDQVYAKGYGFLPFAKIMVNNLRSKYGQKLLDTTKKATTNALKTASKGAIQKTAEATGNMVGNKIAEKIAKAASTHEDKKKIICTTNRDAVM